ncbi:DUF4253 domain-containing protein [Ideonella sp.]|uniref:DUF4253 domain-containing protein n=1 Tax=Ideonella sp. TaxID=1929293 RepID=UPI0037C03B72
MIQSIDELANVLRGTGLEGRALGEVWQHCGTDPVFTVALEAGREYDEQALLRSLMAQTGRYALVSSKDHVDMTFCESAPSAPPEWDWIEATAAETLLVDGSAYLATGGSLSRFSETRTDDFSGWLAIDLSHPSHPLSDIQRRFGEAPSVQQICDLRDSGVLRSDADFERWLLRWEVERFGDAALLPPSFHYLDGHEFSEPHPRVAVLLPTQQSWKALLYTAWYGLEGGGAAELAASLRVWAENYGAELVAAFGTTLYLQVARRPSNIDEAFVLALEHRHFASDTFVLPGVSTRDHARALLTLDRWFFHSRP